MEYIEIDFNEEEEFEDDEDLEDDDELEESEEAEYSFKCPYCETKHVLPDNIDCKHYWFGYESINQQPLFMDGRLYDAIWEMLSIGLSDGPELYEELWQNEYKPEDDSEPAQSEIDNARAECISYYLESFISIDDVFWFMDRLPQFSGYDSHATLATIDDCEGNSTSYLFLDDVFSE